ncbi:MAG: FKBP-type peptidyl-prolyl cis-trans isomerase [Propionibacteriaceae bacterium]|nr:FKBP-type peptidyl-prolyl cis-trans isomerase [Propionibacteriaceae bacterium]
MNRRLRAVVPATLAIALLALSACGSEEPAGQETPAPTAAAETPAETPADTPTTEATTSATDLDAITVDGAAGEQPTVEVPAPFGVDETITKVLTPGDGATIAENGTAEVHYLGVNGRTGEPFDDSWTGGQPVAFPLDQVVPGFQKGLTGQQVGSRVLIAMPGTDGYDSSGGSPQAGIQVGDTLVFVVDILGTPLERAEGETVAPREGLPGVEFSGDTPTVTVPQGAEAPTELVVQPLIRGTGEPVQPTDVITARYQASLWKNGEVIADTYGSAPEEGPLASLIPAWQEGLTDQPVGSRVLIVAPPNLAYPEDPGARTPNPAAGETVVYVVDILYAQSAQQPG